MENIIYPVLSSLILAGIFWLIKIIRKSVVKPIQYLDCRFEILIDYMKEESGNGFSKFYDEALVRKLREKNLQEKI
jgi:hypothetical protein